MSLEDTISDCVLIKSIRAYVNDSDAKVSIVTKDVRLATKPGDNYLSFVYQVGVKYKITDDPLEYDVQFIIKSIQGNEMFANLLKESQVFEKEKLMYESILPELEKIADISFAPKCFYIQDEKDKLLVFSDIKELGYKMGDREKGLDFEHCKLLIEHLAIYHATSVVFVEEKRDLIEICSSGMSSDPILVDYIFKSHLTALITAMEQWTEPEFQGLPQKLKKIAENHVAVYKQAMKTDQDEFRVLNHGDAWCNNFMFAYDGNGAPSDVIFLDFQIPFYTSPAYDLHYFIITSPDMETRLNREKDLLRIYKNRFNEKVCDLGADQHQLTEEKFSRAYKQKSLFGFNMMLTLLPVIMRKGPQEGDDPTDKEANLRNMIESSFSNEDFIAILKYSLRKFKKMGTFEGISERE